MNLFLFILIFVLKIWQKLFKIYEECECQSPPRVTDKLILEELEHPQSTK
jgi:hypothetical protein